MNENSILNFGKYKGKTIASVLKLDPSYLVWMVDGADMDLDRQTYEKAIDLARDKEYSKYEDLDWGDFNT